mmetsp:Transcript_11159/g.27086  ORF Transcript_11159/g.27086 Transcript_11159/m.27086 type:complete len:213 (-) Transcript_11159:232-870(-)
MASNSSTPSASLCEYRVSTFSSFAASPHISLHVSSTSPKLPVLIKALAMSLLLRSLRKAFSCVLDRFLGSVIWGILSIKILISCKGFSALAAGIFFGEGGAGALPSSLRPSRCVNAGGVEGGGGAGARAGPSKSSKTCLEEMVGLLCSVTRLVRTASFSIASNMVPSAKLSIIAETTPVAVASLSKLLSNSIVTSTRTDVVPYSPALRASID